MPNKATGTNGVTLVEVMIALVVLLIVFMGLMQVSIVAIQGNMRNVLRDEAVRTTADVMVQLRSAPFDDIDRSGAADPAMAVPPNNQLNFTWDQDGTVDGVHNVSIRNATIPYTVGVNVRWVDADHKRIAITTTWAWQGENFTHSISTVRRRS